MHACMHGWEWSWGLTTKRMMATTPVSMPKQATVIRVTISSSLLEALGRMYVCA